MRCRGVTGRRGAAAARERPMAPLAGAHRRCVDVEADFVATDLSIVPGAAGTGHGPGARVERDA